MQEYLVATNRQDIADHTPVISMTEISYWLIVKIPPEVAENYCLIEIKSCEESASDKTSEILKYSKCHPGKIWIDIPWNFMHKEIGHHIYRLEFVNKYTDDILFLFFGYIIQNDNPEKPYYYMEHVPG